MIKDLIMSKKTHTKLRTSREVIYQIIWDERLHTHEYSIEYEERFSGMREIPVVDFEPDGEIPWHRIWRIKQGGTIVWDRKARIDRIGQSQHNTPTHSTKSVTKPPKRRVSTKTKQHTPAHQAPFLPQPTYQFDPIHKQWQPLSSTESRTSIPAPSSLRIVSFNVLMDPEACYHTPTRQLHLFNTLKEAQADIIALQEVTPTFLQTLLTQEWVRGQYYCSDEPEGTQLTPYGQIILSRYPVAFERQESNSPKRILCGEWHTKEGAIEIAVVHLTSNRAKQPAKKRYLQLDHLLEELERHSDVKTRIILGDFNIMSEQSDPDSIERFMLEGYEDVWHTLHPKDSGETFDPTRNALAKQTSTTGQKARYDRIYVNSEAYHPHTCTRLGMAPIPHKEKLYLSDHYGLLCQIEASTETSTSFSEIPPTLKTAVALIPPESVWEPIQALRAQYDRRFTRWMPHITVFFQFVPEEHFDDIALALQQLLEETGPFEIMFKEFRSFQHAKQHTIWLHPEIHPPDRLKDFHAALLKIFPQCKERIAGREEWHPHLSIGQVSASKAPAVLRALQQSWQPIHCTIDTLSLIRREKDAPASVHTQLPLQPTPSGHSSKHQVVKLPQTLQEVLQQHTLYTTEDTSKQTLLAQTHACVASWNEQHTSTPLQAYSIGSTGLQVALPQSDVDVLLCCSKLTKPKEVFQAIGSALRGHTQELVERSVVDAQIPVYKAYFEGTTLDIQLAHLPQQWRETAPESWRTLDITALTPSQRLMVQSLMDQHTLRTYLDEQNARPLLYLLKAWARRHQLDKQAWGGIGGIAWAILAVAAHRACQLSPEMPLLQQVKKTFGWLAGDALKAGISLEGIPEETSSAIAIWTPTAPYVNSTRQVTHNTAKQLKRAFTSAHQIGEKESSEQNYWTALFTDLPTLQGDITVTLTLDTASALAQHNTIGALEKRALSWLNTLETTAHIECQSLHFTTHPMWSVQMTFINTHPSESIDTNAIQAALETLQQDLDTSLGQQPHTTFHYTF
tara:strand:+ start:81 stop:3134 length:3054 start_codon:yes stop_codon:yes gene_type:complete